MVSERWHLAERSGLLTFYITCIHTLHVFSFAEVTVKLELQSSSSQKKGTDERLLPTWYFTSLYSVGGIFSVLVNYISLNIVQKTLKEHNIILIINKDKSMIKCKCLKIVM